MNTREQFGKYLLLKKLSEDRLGETFRAGKLGSTGMERVALLRVFNGQGLDGQRLWDAAQRRVALQQALHSPNIGEGIEAGEVQGIPFVAYDYVSGKNLATLCEQAAKKQSHIPTEHALLITERIALALAAASEHRYDDERILHGFVVPHLVMISNEGETRLLGFEVGPGLRGFVTNPVIRQYFGRYLAPETLAGSPLHKSDDIYSLGVILFELLTGKPLPPPAPDGYGSVIAQARMAADDAPLADELKGLLQRSLIAREQRIADAATWHKALNRWMFEGQYNPTTFNLAFFMHNLFRQEIERESQEIEIEKTLPLPVQAPPTPPPAPAAAPVRETTGVREGSGVREATGVRTGTGTGVREMTGTYAGQPPKKSNAGLMAAVAVLVLAVGAGGYFVMSSKKGDDGAADTAEAQPLAGGTDVPVEPPPPAGPSPEEVQTKIDEMITARADALEEELRGHYDQQLKELQKQLDQAQKEKKDREELLVKQRQVDEERKRREAEAVQQAEAERKRLEEEAVKKQAEEDAAKLAAKEAAPPPPPAAPPPKPAAPAVRRGDLVEPGPGVIPPKLERQAAARFPEMARKIGKTAATVTVRVLVDENGKVIDTQQVDKVGFGFDTEALAVAKKSTFQPATKNGVPVKMWIEFKVGFKG